MTKPNGFHCHEVLHAASTEGLLALRTRIA